MTGKNTTKWKKIFANHIPHKDSISKIYKELLRLHNKNTTNPTDREGNLRIFIRIAWI